MVVPKTVNMFNSHFPTKGAAWYEKKSRMQRFLSKSQLEFYGNIIASIQI